LFGEFVPESHRVLAECNLIGKSAKRRVLDVAIAKRCRYEGVLEIDENGERDGIVDRPLGIDAELLVFNAEAALGSPPLSLVAANRIDGVIAERIRLSAQLNLRRRPRRARWLRLRIGVGRHLDQNAGRFDAARPLVGFIVGGAGSDLGPRGSFARGSGPDLVKPLADLSEVLVENFSDLVCLGRKAARLFGFTRLA